MFYTAEDWKILNYRITEREGKMENIDGYVVYSKELYNDAEARAKITGETILERCGKSRRLRHIANVDERNSIYKSFAKANGWCEDASLYAGDYGCFNEFCKAFFLDINDYIVKENKIPKEGNVIKLASVEEATDVGNNVLHIMVLLRRICNDIEMHKLHATCGFEEGAEKTLNNNHSETIKNINYINKNLITHSEDTRAGNKQLEIIAKNSAEQTELLKRIIEKMDKLETRQKETNERLMGLANTNAASAANVSKMVGFVDRFTRR